MAAPTLSVLYANRLLQVPLAKLRRMAFVGRLLPVSAHATQAELIDAIVEDDRHRRVPRFSALYVMNFRPNKASLSKRASQAFRGATMAPEWSSVLAHARLVIRGIAIGPPSTESFLEDDDLVTADDEDAMAMPEMTAFVRKMLRLNSAVVTVAGQRGLPGQRAHVDCWGPEKLIRYLHHYLPLQDGASFVTGMAPIELDGSIVAGRYSYDRFLPALSATDIANPTPLVGGVNFVGVQAWIKGAPQMLDLLNAHDYAVLFAFDATFGRDTLLDALLTEIDIYRRTYPGDLPPIEGAEED